MASILHFGLFIIFLVQGTVHGSKKFREEITRDNTLINTNVGQIRGVRATDGNYTMFMGIPFGQVDRNNPFGQSTPYPAFSGIFEAINDVVLCPQSMLNGTITGVIDCLQLNIFVPDTASPTNPLPVLVWIHGGGFTLGSANTEVYGPSLLVRHDIILVTINYRLGPYGFMCLNTPEIPGNQGMKDQVLALRWLRNNIAFFGGDADKMTAFGQSAGSMSVHLHVISPQEDFFDKIILHSGSAMTSDVIMEADPTVPIRIAENLGFTTNAVTEALQYLATADPHLVIQAASRASAMFWPCIETEHNNVESFLTDYPINLDTPKLRNKSVLLGYTDDETITSFANIPAEIFERLNVFSSTLNNFFTFEDEQQQRLETFITNFYLGGKRMSREVIHEVADFQSDFIFNYPIDRCINAFLENGVDNIFYFVFSYLGDRNFMKVVTNVTMGGAAHADELGYLFDMRVFPQAPSPEDQLVIDRMTTMWTNFIKYGDPTPVTNALLPIKWEAITRGSSKYYIDINTELTLGTNPFHKRMSFWDLFYDAHEEFQIGYRDTSHATALNSISKMYLLVALFWILYN